MPWSCVPLHGVLCDAVRFDCGTAKELEKSNLKLSLMEDVELRAFANEILSHMVG